MNSISDQKIPVINAQDVRLSLSSIAGSVDILRGISLQIYPGETVSIVGPSGAGKTSLMMVLAGMEAVTSGSVMVSGHDLTTLDEDALALFRRDNVGIVFQSFHLVPTMTALENVAVPLEFGRQANAQSRAKIALEAVGLSHRIQHYPSQLSGGEQQRVGLARALVAEPTLLLADEPTGNLDAKTGGVVMDMMFELGERNGAALVLITHDPALSKRCSRQIKIADGLIADDQKVNHTLT